MQNGKIAFLAFFVVTAFWGGFRSYGQSFKEDSLVVRAILDSNDLSYVYVFEVASVTDNRITGLNFYNKNLTTLPPIIGKLDKLLGINLRENFLTEVPEQIKKCIELDDLLLTNNKIAFLPDSLGCLVNLTKLDVGVNELKQLPSTIGNLKKLKRLHVSFNQLTEIPSEIGGCDSLLGLRCSSNKLTFLPDEIVNLKHLWQIYASGNKIERLPENIGDLTSLESLDLSYNKLTTLPESIVKLTLPYGIGVAWNYLDSANLSPAVIEWLAGYFPKWYEYQYDISEINKPLNGSSPVILKIIPGKDEVRYTLFESQYVKITLFFSNGREIANLESGYKSKGMHTVSLHSINCGTGMYFLLFSSEYHQQIKRSLFIR